MIKLNRNIGLLLVALLCVAFHSCKDDDTVVSTISFFEKFSAVPIPLVVAEADETYSVEVAFGEKQVMDVNVTVSVAATSTATEGVDFDLVSHEFSALALSSGTIEILVHSDFEPEGNETVVLHFESADPHGLPTASESLVLTIRDSIYPASIALNWEGEYTDSSGTSSLCGAIDIDLFLADDQGNFVGGNGGATANCPESIFVNLPDGTYDIIANLWENSVLDSPGLIESPITMEVKMFKGGVVVEANSTIKYNTGNFNQVPLWTTFTPSDQAGVALADVGTITIGGGKVTLIDPAGNVVGSFDK
ncbi:MAG TPA: hypothetical protein VFG10_12035 [Saprospiraceae bacterium]|nr:hypothetical protein [Saprospiraceae bacterium]